MPKFLDNTSVKGAIARRRIDIRRARMLHVPVYLETYTRGPGDKPLLVEERLYDEILVDPKGKVSRKLKSNNDPDAFDAVAEQCRSRPIRLTLHEAQLAPLFERRPITAILSGSRAGKTYLECNWMVLQWLKRGFRGANFGWLCPTRKQTRFPIQMLITGPKPILPKELVVRWPLKAESADQVIELLDGSLIWLQHGNSDGDHLRGYKMEAYCIDEITAVDRVENYRIAANRLVDSGGPMMIGSTPKQNHWAKSEIIDRGETEEGAEVIANYNFTCFDNPWVKLSYLENYIKGHGGRNDPVIRREVFGEWIADGNVAFPDWDPAIHMETGSGMDVGAFGLRDCTEAACREHWKDAKDFRYVGGQDFNVNPCATVIAQVFGDPKDWETWGIFVLDEVLNRSTNTDGHAEDLASKYPGIPLACDPSGAMKNGPKAQLGKWARGSTTNVKIMRHHGFAARAAAYKGGKASFVLQTDSLALTNWLFKRGKIIVHQRCPELRRALSELLTKPDGTLAKTSGTESLTDQMSAPVDALRYLAIALFYKRWWALFRGRQSGQWLI